MVGLTLVVCMAASVLSLSCLHQSGAREETGARGGRGLACAVTRESFRIMPLSGGHYCANCTS